MSKPKVIAFYLPQFHPIKENDEWYGKGFTEWTNVGKAKPLFKGHYQPHVPADLGYYDLRLPEVREAQAELAKEAGIDAFCYYHYWFGKGKIIMEKPLQEVVKRGKPDFPFMVCWANHSFYNKSWNKDAKNINQSLLIEQTYPGEQDIIDHFNFLLPVFKDERYLKINGKLAFVIYDYIGLPKDFFNKMKIIWENLATTNNLPGFNFIGYTSNASLILNNKFNALDSVIYDPIVNAFLKRTPNKFQRKFIKVKEQISEILKLPIRKKNYKEAIKFLVHSIELRNNVYPIIIPNWDRSPRVGYGATILHNSTPQLFKKHIKNVLDIVMKKPLEDRIIFLKAWNEWAEGNYMEPDLKYGKSYIKTLKETLEEI